MLEDEAALAVFTEFLQRTWISGSWDGGLRPVEDIQVDLRDWDTMSQKEQLQWAEKLDLRVHWMQDNPKDPGPDRASLRIPLDIDSNHPKYLYLIFTGPPLNIYQIFMNIPLKLVAPRCFGSSGFRHFWVTLTRNCRKFCFQQDA